MTEPVSTISGAVTKALTAIKDFPLWLLGGIAISLTTFRSVPELSAAVPQEARPWLTLGAGTATILTACRLGSLIISHINSYRAKVEARRTFHLTPMSQRSHWGPTRQPDGTIVSLIRTELIAKNRTDKILSLVTARVVRPKISGEVLQVFIHTDTGEDPIVGVLWPGGTSRVLVTIMIRGHPGHVRKNPVDLTAVLAVADEEGNEQRVKLPLKAFPVLFEGAK